MVYLGIERLPGGGFLPHEVGCLGESILRGRSDDCIAMSLQVIAQAHLEISPGREENVDTWSAQNCRGSWDSDPV
jgi:hypothetical protein